MKRIYLIVGILFLISSIGYSQNDLVTRRSNNFNKKQTHTTEKVRNFPSISADRIPSAITKPKDISSLGLRAGSSMISYDFTAGMPATFTLVDGDCGWTVSSSGGSSSFLIPAHDGNYAYVNDDDCNGDMSDVWMKLPAIDLSDALAPVLQFDNFRRISTDILTIKVSTDGSDWDDVATYTNSITAWQTETVDLSDYTGESTVYIAFHYNDAGAWNYGWAVDNITINDSNEHDFMAVNITPAYVASGTTVSPKVTIKNIGTTTETAWTVVLTDGGSYTSTVNGTQSIAPGATYAVDMDAWTPSANSTLTATITLTGDDDITDNQITKSITVGAGYADLTYAGNAVTHEYGTIDLLTGGFTAIGGYSTDVFPVGEDYDGNYIYRVLNDNTIGLVYPNGEFDVLGTLHGVDGTITGIAYDWNNDVMYANIMYTTDGGFTYYPRLCTIDMNTFALTLVGQGTIVAFMRGMDFASDGYLYGPSFISQELIKIDPATGEYSAVGAIGLTLNYAQDVSFDGIEQRLYSITCSLSEARFGYYDLTTGAFTTIYNYGAGQQYPTIVVTKNPLSAYIVTPANGATSVAINATVSATFSGNVSAVTNLNGITISPNPGGVDASITANVLTIIHDDFDNDKTYTVTIPAGALNEYTEAISWSFTTVAAAPSCPTITTFPWTEGFEDASSTRACWTQEYVTGDSDWIFATGSNGGTINGAHSGTKNARFISSSQYDYATKLISPVLDLSGMTNAELNFWYGQQNWSGDQNELKVYYRTASAAAWVQIAHYTSNINTWTEVTLTLPSTSATYQIAFEGINNWGYTNVIDDVIVRSTGATPVTISSTTPLDAATNVATNAAVSVTFSDDITSASLTGISFTPAVTNTLASITDNVLTIAHDAFANNTAYTVTIPAGALNEYAGAISWSFTTLPSNDATLSNLTVSAGTLTPAFVPGTYSYTVTVPYLTDEINLTARKNHPGASITGDTGTKPLIVGPNVFTIVVTAEDGITKLTYTVTVNRRTEAVAPSSLPQGLEATYGDLLSNVALPDGFRWLDPSALVGDVSSSPVLVRALYNPDPQNYKDYEVELLLTILPRNIQVTVEANPVYTYTGLPITVTATVTVSSLRSSQEVIPALEYLYYRNGQLLDKAVNAGEYELIVRSADVNYRGESTVTFTIEKAQPVIEASDVVVNEGDPVVIAPNLTGGYDVEVLSGSLLILYKGVNGTRYNLAETTPFEVGEYLVRISTSGNENYLPAETQISLKIVTGEVFIDEIASGTFRIYPNPVKDLLWIESKEAGIRKIEVMDISGRMIYSQQMKEMKGMKEMKEMKGMEQEVTIDTSSWARGNYIVRIITNKGVKTVKVMKN